MPWDQQMTYNDLGHIWSWSQIPHSWFPISPAAERGAAGIYLRLPTTYRTHPGITVTRTWTLI